MSGDHHGPQQSHCVVPRHVKFHLLIVASKLEGTKPVNICNQTVVVAPNGAEAR